MSEPTLEERIAELDRLERAATGGTWTWDPAPDDWGIETDAIGFEPIILCGEVSSTMPDNPNDGPLIVAARNLVRPLLERLRKVERERMSEAMRCERCDFVFDSPGELARTTCPNSCGPLTRMTYREAHASASRAVDEMCDAKLEAEERVDSRARRSAAAGGSEGAEDRRGARARSDAAPLGERERAGAMSEKLSDQLRRHSRVTIIDANDEQVARAVLVIAVAALESTADGLRARNGELEAQLREAVRQSGPQWEGLRAERDRLRVAADALKALADSLTAQRDAERESSVRLTAERYLDRAALRLCGEALAKVERWSDFPPGEDGASYGYSYGSYGERDYMREVARAALALPAVVAAMKGGE